MHQRHSTASIYGSGVSLNKFLVWLGNSLGHVVPERAGHTVGSTRRSRHEGLLLWDQHFRGSFSGFPLATFLQGLCAQSNLISLVVPLRSLVPRQLVGLTRWRREGKQDWPPRRCSALRTQGCDMSNCCFSRDELGATPQANPNGRGKMPNKYKEGTERDAQIF